MGSLTTTDGPPTTTTTTADGQITIRKATPQDAEQIAALGAAVFEATFADSGCTPEQLRSYLEEAYSVPAVRATLANPAQDTLVATTTTAETAGDAGGAGAGEGAAAVLGFAVLNHATSPAEPAVRGYPGPVEVQRLYVGLGAHGRGIGTALMGAVEALARARGYETAWLGVWERNFRAQRVYERLGYRRVGEHVFDVGGDEQVDWILVKAL